MANKVKMSLAVKIVGISGLLVAAVVAALIIITINISTEQVFITEEHNLEQMADIVKKLLDTEIEALMEKSELMSEHTELVEHMIDSDSERLEEYIEHEYEKSDFFDELVLFDEDGVMINNHPNDEMVGDKVSDYEDFKHVWDNLHKNTDEVFLDHDVYESESSGRPVFLIGSAVMHDGDLLGMLLMVIDTQNFYKHYLADMVFAERGYAYLADNTGIMIAHKDTSMNLKDQSSEEFMISTKELIENGAEHGRVDYVFNGDKKLLRFDTLEGVPWHVALTVYEKDLTKLADTLSFNMLVVGGISLITLIILLIFMTVIFVSKPIGKVTVELTNGSNNLESASMQIASSSQQLSSGNSELAASIEEITSSLEELQSVIELNTKNINESELLMKETNENSQKVSGDISNLSEALTEIGDNSEEIVNIVKVIEDIAFQTNILALNAAVEAGRAGEAGSGFAVVADQVKDLAQKSSESSKETAKLIKTAIDSITRGQEIGKTVKVAQDKASEMSNNVTILLNEVNRASKEQMKGVNQITQAITQTNSVVQQTAASAEETSSASEELLGQSVSLNEVVDSLNIVIKGKKVERESVSIEKKSHVSSNHKKALPLDAKNSEKFDPNDIIPMNDEFKEF